MLNSYLIGIYFRYILIIFIALQIFYVGIDFIGASNSLPDSANLQFLYAMYTAGAAMKITLPLSLIFAMIAAKIHLIRANELVIIYALGVSKRQVINPFIWIASLVSFLYLAAQATPFAYFDQKALSIKSDRYFVTVTEDVFVKYDNSYIYIERLFPLQQTAIGLRIFELDSSGLKRIITSESALFTQNRWRLFEGEIVNKPKVSGIQDAGTRTETFETYDMLEGFEPLILDKVYEGKASYSLLDAISAIRILRAQEVNINRIISALVTAVTIPFFAPVLVVIIFFFVPISSRFFNVALFSSAAIFATLVAWGFLFAMSTLALNGTINVWLGVVLPFVLLILTALYFYKKFS